MNRVTSKILHDLENRIKKFFGEFILGSGYGYYNINVQYPKGESSIRTLEPGLTAREAYYYMSGFLACYYNTKEEGSNEVPVELLKQAIIEITDIELGVYPQSFEGKYEKRTEYMEGWNACVMAHVEAVFGVLKKLGIHIDKEGNITFTGSS